MRQNFIFHLLELIQVTKNEVFRYLSIKNNHSNYPCKISKNNTSKRFRREKFDLDKIDFSPSNHYF